MLKRTIEKGNKPVEMPVPGFDKKEFTFKTGPQDQVRVIVKNNVKAEAGDLPADGDLPATDQFTPIRLVINLKLSTQPKQSNYEIGLKVRFSPDDEREAGGREKLKLAYLKGSEWKVLRDTTWGNDYIASVAVPDFPEDPPIATGH
jgi:hypothetical protein